MKISVIIPTRNEEAGIAETLRNLRQTSRHLPVEIVVVDGQSTDRTMEIAKNNAHRVIESKKCGRAFQMHVGAQNASGDIFFFLHADTLPPENWQLCIQEEFLENPSPPCAAAFGLRFDAAGFSYRLIGGLSRLRTWITGVPHGDQGLAVKRTDYFASGGFPDVPLMEEYFLIPKLRKRGRVKVFREKALTSSRKYEQSGPIRNSLRNSLFLLLFHLGVSPQRIANWYGRH